MSDEIHREVRDAMLASMQNEAVTPKANLEAKLNQLTNQVVDALDLKTDMARLYVFEALRLMILFDKKQQDYGSQNIARFGEKGVLVRTNDKLERLKNLLWDSDGPVAPNHEALSDTWDDIHVYGLIGRLCNDRKWR